MIHCTANLRTTILDVRGFYSNTTVILRHGILISMGISPEVLSQHILVGIVLVERLGVWHDKSVRRWVPCGMSYYYHYYSHDHELLSLLLLVLLLIWLVLSLLLLDERRAGCRSGAGCVATYTILHYITSYDIVNIMYIYIYTCIDLSLSLYIYIYIYINTNNNDNNDNNNDDFDHNKRQLASGTTRTALRKSTFSKVPIRLLHLHCLLLLKRSCIDFSSSCTDVGV